jgi:hypothetical protein
MSGAPPAVTGAAVADHPATLAWLALHPEGGRPTGIEVLKERKSSAAYRLHGAAKAGPLVAKRSPDEQHATEYGFYARVLPALTIETPHCHGAVRDERGSWLFLEDAGERWYRPDRADHRRLAGEVLAALHTAPEELRHGVPGQSVADYLETLRATRTALGEALAHPRLEAADLRLLCAILGHLDSLELHWPQVADACAVIPDGLVHGDFVPKNIRVGSRAGAVALVVFDWGTAGWGSPGADLSELSRVDGEGLRAYLKRARSARPGVGLADLQRVAAAGKAFRLVNAVEWETRSFAYHWIERSLRYLLAYEQYLRDLLTEQGWLRS